MSSVVLDNSASSQFGANTSTLTANSARVGAGGVVSTGTIVGGNSASNGGVFYRGLTVSDPNPAAPATQTPFSQTTYAIDQAGGGLNPNQLQKFVYADPRVSGPQTIQQYEEGYYVPTATAFVAPALAADTIFVNRPVQCAALDYTPFNGTLLTTAAPVVVPCAGITAGSVVELRLVGGTAAAFTAAAAGGLVEPAITVQVGATTAASTFTAAATPAGWTYAWKVLRS